MSDARLESLLRAPRVALYGGTFDPVHQGHVHVAESAADLLALDAVLFTPAARSPHKSAGQATPGALRAELLRVATAHDPRFGVWDVELERDPSFTIDTLCELRRIRGERAGEPFLILGVDQLPGFERWREVEQILELSRPIVVERGGAHGIDAAEQFARLAEVLPERLASLLARGHLLLDDPHPASATAIRAALAAGREPGHLAPAVLARIRELGLYRP